MTRVLDAMIGIITILLVVLYSTHIIDWAWWIVLMPLFAYLGTAFIVISLFFILIYVLSVKGLVDTMKLFSNRK